MNKDVPLVISPHGMLSPGALEISKQKKQLARPILEEPHFKAAHVIHALTRDEQKEIKDFGVRKPIAIIPNGVEIPDSSATRPANQKKTLLFLGRLHPKKGLDQFIESWGVVAPSDWVFKISGPGETEYVSKLQASIERLGIQDSVSISGPVYDKDKAEAFSTSHAFVLPSKSEGQPVAALEAWSYGLPILKTRECNLTEGFDLRAAKELSLNPEDQIRDLSSFLKFSDPDLDEMGKRGRDLVGRKFAWNKIGQSYESLYRWTIGEVPPPDFLF